MDDDLDLFIRPVLSELLARFPDTDLVGFTKTDEQSVRLPSDEDDVRLPVTDLNIVQSLP